MAKRRLLFGLKLCSQIKSCMTFDKRNSTTAAEEKKRESSLHSFNSSIGKKVPDVEIAEDDEDDHAMDADKYVASIVPDTDDPTMPAFT